MTDESMIYRRGTEIAAKRKMKTDPCVVTVAACAERSSSVANRFLLTQSSIAPC